MKSAEYGFKKRFCQKDIVEEFKNPIILFKNVGCVAVKEFLTLSLSISRFAKVAISLLKKLAIVKHAITDSF
jgi:hypothetical protein